MNGVKPTYATISDFSYPGARPLFIYVKKAHLDAIPGLREFIAEWAKSMTDAPVMTCGSVGLNVEMFANLFDDQEPSELSAERDLRMLAAEHGFGDFDEERADGRRVHGHSVGAAEGGRQADRPARRGGHGCRGEFG